MSHLKVRGAEKSFSGRNILTGINLDIHSGKIVAILGPNGSGKSTLFSSIIGFQSLDKGKIMLDGYDLTNMPVNNRALLGLGYLPQDSSIIGSLTTQDNLLFILEFLEKDKKKNHEKIERVISQFNLEKVRHSKSEVLSGGERRRLEIARITLINPKIVMLDEPFAGVDPLAIFDIKSILSSLSRLLNIGIFITDHNVRETFDIVDYAYILSNGRILAEGSPEYLSSNDLVKANYLGKDFVYKKLSKI